jgi:methylenetetrahydrofolate dehydrogenase (NADP+)/methenyltetrahydrofolate cyclohydrolase
MVTILDGKATTKTIMEELSNQIESLKVGGITPGLALVLTGSEKNSARYVKLKKKRAEKIGIYTEFHQLEDTTQDVLIRLIKNLNEDPKIHGIMVQLPLMEGLDELAAVDAIKPEKDVDGLSPNTLGKILMGEEAYMPAGVDAILELLERYNLDIEGKHWVVVGSSNFLSKPLVAALVNKNVKVSVCREDDTDYHNLVKSADILSTEIFRKHAITSNMVKKGVIIIDNGNNYEGKKVYGDVDYEEISKKASAITPVPGGVGPILIAMLLKNTILAAKKSTV